MNNFVALKENGRVVTPAKHNQLVDLVQRIALSPSSDYRIKQIGSGTTLEIIHPVVKPTPAEPYPFKIIPIKGTDTFNVSMGVVNSQLPSNINSTFTASDGDAVWVQANLSWTSGYPTITSLFIDNGSSLPSGANEGIEPTVVAQLLGYVYVTDDVIVATYNAIQNSLNFYRHVTSVDCNRSYYAIAWNAV